MVSIANNTAGGNAINGQVQHYKCVKTAVVWRVVLILIVIYVCCTHVYDFCIKILFCQLKKSFVYFFFIL